MAKVGTKVCIYCVYACMCAFQWVCMFADKVMAVTRSCYFCNALNKLIKCLSRKDGHVFKGVLIREGCLFIHVHLRTIQIK